MGSALLYFAIVVMWLSVLLPMWLRRDRHVDDQAYDEQPAETTLTESPVTSPEDVESSEAAEADTIVETPSSDRSTREAGPGGAATPTAATPAATTAAPRRDAKLRQTRILARRRRRLLWSILLVLASVVTAAVRVMPWWAVAPSGVLLVGYLAVLRVAVRVDREQRERAARARAEHLRRQRERRRALAAMAQEAEIIQFEARRRSQVFDQYADGRRAVGD
jgi:hypothetical protein